MHASLARWCHRDSTHTLATRGLIYMSAHLRSGPLALTSCNLILNFCFLLCSFAARLGALELNFAEWDGERAKGHFATYLPSRMHTFACSVLWFIGQAGGDLHVKGAGRQGVSGGAGGAIGLPELSRLCKCMYLQYLDKQIGFKFSHLSKIF